MFFRHTVGMEWVRHFQHPCFDVEVYGLAAGGSVRVRCSRCTVNVRLRAGQHGGERGLANDEQIIYDQRPVGSVLFIPTGQSFSLCSDGGGEYVTLRIDHSFMRAILPFDLPNPEMMPPFHMPELEQLMRRMASRICDVSPDEMEPLARSAGVLMGRHMASRHQKGEGTVFRSRLPRVLAHIEAHLADELPLDKLAAMAGMSVSAFRRNFALVTGMPPHKFIMAARVRRAQVLLMDESLPLAVIAHEVGFGTQSRFCTVFREVAGVTPSEYRRRQAA